MSEWPEVVSFSMAPFGYVVQVSLVQSDENGATYKCNKCPESGTFSTYQEFRDHFREHVDAAH